MLTNYSSNSDDFECLKDKIGAIVNEKIDQNAIEENIKKQNLYFDSRYLNPFNKVASIIKEIN